MELRVVVMFYSALLGATLPAHALKQTLTIGTLYQLLVFVSMRIETN